MEYILIHYHEIALKGKNRIFFEQKLADNIKKMLNGSSKVSRLNGRILVETKNREKALKALKFVFGISSYSPVLVCKTELSEIKKNSLKLLSNTTSSINNKTFKIETKRAYKQFSKNSMEISRDVGAYILKHKNNLKVDVKNPKIKINVEVLKDKTFIYTKKIKGLGGLPVGTSGKMLVLLSGGIDSPVASYLMMKRGVSLDFIHFHSYPYTDKASIEKAEELKKILEKYQGAGKIYSVPIIDFQKEVVKKCEDKYRILLYRRLMYKVAEKFAQKLGANALVSGDNLGQVASQTIENMAVIQNGIDLPIMRPLVGFDKEEIIELAKKIGTFEISIEPHGDCCSVFMPKSPVTKAKIENISEQEKKIGMDKWVEKAVLSI